MIDFWVAVLLTAIVSVLTVLADWVASRLIVGARIIGTLSEILRAGLSQEEKIQRATHELEQFKASQLSALVWGADLATVAISMDFAALGIWIHAPQMFPFFARFNSAGSSRDIPVWLIVIGLHALLLVVSLILRRTHAEAVGTIGADVAFPSAPWLARNGWMFAANSTGSVSLLTAMVVFTNAI